MNLEDSSDELAATTANRFVVRTLASTYSPFASMPDELATVLADL